MHPLYSELFDSYVPKLNPLIMNGLATHTLQYAEKYIDIAFRSIAECFPKELTYAGYERCTPQEEYEFATKVKSTKRTYDLAQSDIYLVKFNFHWNGQLFDSRYIYLPFVGDGGVFTLSGSLYHITPILSDKVISPDGGNLFIRLWQYKLTFRRLPYTIVANGVREHIRVAWSNIYNQSKDRKVPQTTLAMTSLAHYLFAKYGFTEVFRKYVGFVPIVGLGSEVNSETYPEDKWVVVGSSHLTFKPKTYKGEFYEGTKIQVAIPKEHWTEFMQNMIAGFFYCLDHFPSRLTLETINHTPTWKILLGHILFSGLYGEDKLFAQVTEHFTSLDSYVDNNAIEKLAEKNCHIKDFYDLLVVIIDKFNVLTSDSTEANNMYGKYLDVLYYVLYPITHSIFNTKFNLMKASSKRNLGPTDIQEIFNRTIKPGKIFQLTTGNIVTETVAYSGDHKYFKLTSKASEQESIAGGKRRGGKRKVVNENAYINPSQLEGGSFLYLSKSNPSPTNRINPYLTIDPATGTILPNPKFEKELDVLGQMLSRR